MPVLVPYSQRQPRPETSASTLNDNNLLTLQLASLEAARTRQLADIERRLAEQYSSVSSVSQLAQRATLDSMREQFERDKLALLDREREQHRKEIGAPLLVQCICNYSLRYVYSVT